MGAQNKQFGNVGNLGDILKHGALVSLVELILAQARRVVWVDTHAFLLEAPCVDHGAWKRETNRQVAAYPDLGRYVTLQRNLADSSRYRCSTGLVVDAVREAGHEAPVLILGESEQTTRARLETQLARESLTPHVLMEDASALRTVAPPPGVGALLALVDPFSLNESLWTDISVGLARLTESLATAIVLVFTYDQSVERYEWPKAPPGFVGPVAVTSRHAFHLAVYAKGNIAQSCRQRCDALGWGHPKPQIQTATAAGDDAQLRARLTVRGFSRLQGLDEGLHEALKLAVDRATGDSRASLFHQRRFQERVVHLVATHHEIDLSNCTDQAGKIRLLESRLEINHHVVGPLHWLRQQGNRAAHVFDVAPDLETALEGLRRCHQIARWFAMQTAKIDLEELSIGQSEDGTLRRQRRDETLQRKLQANERVNRIQNDKIRQLRSLLERRPTVTASLRLLDTVPDGGSLQWVYFATPRKADRDTTYDLAYRYGIICCDVWKEGGMQKMPNVMQMRPGDVMLLAYGEQGKYQPQLYLRIEGPPGRAAEDTHVMHKLPVELAQVLANAGYKPDPVEKTFTGFRVTPCSDWKDKIQSTLRKPQGQNFLRRWDEVRKKNGWDIGEHQ